MGWYRKLNSRPLSASLHLKPCSLRLSAGIVGTCRLTRKNCHHRSSPSDSCITVSYGLSLRDASLTILFFSLLTCIPVAYLYVLKSLIFLCVRHLTSHCSRSTLGPKTGLRQMVQARYSFGLVGASLPVVLNLFTLGGYCMINSILGAQTLAGVAGGDLSPS